MPSSVSPPFPRRLIVLALLLSLGIGALFARAIWTLRDDQQRFAERTSVNLAYTLDQAIGRTVGALDHSLQGVVHELGNPAAMALPAALRDKLLFDNSLRLSGVGGVLVLDAEGHIVIDSGSAPARQANLADRDYFRVFQGGAHTGLFIGVPVRGRLSGEYSLPLARAYYGADGHFAGVVVGIVRLEHFNGLFAQLNLGPQSSVTLLRVDGTIVTRFPDSDGLVGKSLAGTANMRAVQAARSGTFKGTAVLDGVPRQYAFRHVGDYPLALNVAQAVDTVLADWRRNAWVLGSFALVLMLACVGLAALFARELQRRQQVGVRLAQAERDLRTILDNVPSMIGYWDADLHNRFANHAYVDWFGVGPEKLKQLSMRELLGEALYAKSLPYLEQALQGHAQLFERTVVDAHGAERHSIASYVPDFDGSAVRGIFVQVTDITERKRMEDELFEEKERMRLTLQSIGDAVVCTDAQGRVSYLNPVAERMTGWQAFDAAGRDVDDVVPLHLPGGAAVQPSPLRHALAEVRPLGPTRGVVLQRGDGQRFDVEESASPIADRHGQVTGAVMVLHDVTESVAMAQRMAHLAQYDALTDLPNRVLLQDRARQALAQARRERQGLAVIYLDLDGFKQVNDRLGHDAGDHLLVQFARRLQEATRASDTVSRQGGDEFVVLLPGIGSADTVGPVARKILAVCEEAFLLEGQPVQIGMSGGIALFPQDGETFEALARCADAAMYAAKRQGRLQFRLFAPNGAHRLVR
ncbi:sensor domain-containing diguanylate cyclase [Rhodococcus sp. SRB_17]|nr:sensor domain-containing diguanylate cyclase [Rhodococcus sp. SRB_17]